MLARSWPLWLAVALAACPTRSPRLPAESDAAPPVPGKRVVILMIGDGMGKGQLAAASYYQTGTADGLFLQSLPVHGEITSGSPSGITDSAASATAMACGVVTYNGRLCIDRGGVPGESVIATARAQGWRSGVVSTSYLPHATPAAFTAHNLSRGNLLEIADEQLLVGPVEVMLGGGARYYLPAGDDSSRDDDGLLIGLAGAGYTIVTTAAELAGVTAETEQLFGIFANSHMSYVEDLAEDSSEPSLADMTMRAIELLDRDERGFFLMVEGAHIDRAAHANNATSVIAEVLAFDDAVARVADWASDRDEVTIIVTADHETGGMQVVEGAPAGEYPETSFSTGGHTNDRVDVFASGPESGSFADAIRDHRWIHQLIRARIAGGALVAPARVAVADGDLRDLRHLAAVQSVTSDFGPGMNQLDSLRLDADRYGLAIGIAGLFERNNNAVVVLIDIDFGSGSGPAALGGVLADHEGIADAILSAVAIDGGAISGFGVDFAVVDYGAANPNREQLWDNSGLRGLHAPYGAADDFTWYGVPINFADGVRPQGAAVAPQPFAGLETFIPWADLYPTLDGYVPAGAVVGVVAVLVSSDGTLVSNQALPAFRQAGARVGAAELGGVVVFAVDADSNWVGDGDARPGLATPWR